MMQMMSPVTNYIIVSVIELKLNQGEKNEKRKKNMSVSM